MWFGITANASHWVFGKCFGILNQYSWAILPMGDYLTISFPTFPKKHLWSCVQIVTKYAPAPA